ncbi:hypothetical protein ACFWY6_00915 [Streptomyces sp. NPDC059037]|uniref:hypothetical protein n=1 Tax=Streptomyces sp. NPDC059037 TaxID=3346710 RepID=UPI0036AB2223
MPDTIADLGRRLAKLERRVTALERARRAPYPEWRDLPLTGDTNVPDEEQPPQFRANLWDTTEFSGRIGLIDGRAVDEQLVALLPEGYWPQAPRTVDVASDAVRRTLQLDIDPKGLVRLRVQGGSSVRASWISLDGTSVRTDHDDA